VRKEGGRRHGDRAGAELGAEAAEERGGVYDEGAWDVLAEIREDSAAALIPLEHRWALEDLRSQDAVVCTHGEVIDQVLTGLVADGLAVNHRWSGPRGRPGCWTAPTGDSRMPVTCPHLPMLGAWRRHREP
jgi:hypothetical protein